MNVLSTSVRPFQRYFGICTVYKGYFNTANRHSNSIYLCTGTYNKSLLMLHSWVMKTGRMLIFSFRNATRCHGEYTVECNIMIETKTLYFRLNTRNFVVSRRPFMATIQSCALILDVEHQLCILCHKIR